MPKKKLKTIEDLRELSLQADRLANIGQTEDCLALLRKGLEAAKRISEAYVLFFESEIAHYFDKDYEKEDQLVTRALALLPEDYFLLRNKGVALSMLDRDEEAIEFFDDALGIKPKDYHLLRQKGVALSKVGRLDEAIEIFDDIYEAKSEDTVLLNEYGVASYRRGNYQKAIGLFDKARKLSSDRVIHSNYEHLRNLVEKAAKLSSDEARQETESSLGKRRKKQNESVDELKSFVSNVRKKFEEDIEDFKLDMEETEDRINTYIHADSPLDINRSLFFVLRKWNSYTPILSGADGEDSVGGGYFLFHKGTGVVVDPGYNFIDNFHKAGLRIADISHVVITHAHNDHTIDFESLMTLFFKRSDNGSNGERIKIYLSPSALLKLNSIIGSECKYAEVIPVFPGQTHQLKQGLSMRILPAYHRDVIANDYAIGVRFDLQAKQESRQIILTSDTSLFPTIPGEKSVNPEGPEIWTRYGVKENTRPDLLIPHIGSVRKEEFDTDMNSEYQELFYPNHLGVMGTLRVITELKPRLAVVSEFGEELKSFRPRLMDLLCTSVQEHHRLKGTSKTNVLPGDLPFVYDIAERKIFCVINKEFIPADDIAYKEIHLDKKEETFTYFAKDNRRQVGNWKLRTATEAFMTSCKDQTAPYFKEKQ